MEARRYQVCVWVRLNKRLRMGLKGMPLYAEVTQPALAGGIRYQSVHCDLRYSLRDIGFTRVSVKTAAHLDSLGDEDAGLGLAPDGHTPPFISRGEVNDRRVGAPIGTPPNDDAHGFRIRLCPNVRDSRPTASLRCYALLHAAGESRRPRSWRILHVTVYRSPVRCHPRQPLPTTVMTTRTYHGHPHRLNVLP